ncbi:U3 snoRNP protein [Coemansia helicoidea]|uniref:U3 snoRNP protein n=1 Tax=Coemansia helicoidea TaxID=1286919 RepID=A0ACC1LCN0_9FUNG|nr:U3 snoRNP protein [Coemansia helicoidea]
MGATRTTAARQPGQGPAADTGFAQMMPDAFVERYLEAPGAFVAPTAEARAAAMEIVGRTYDAANYAAKFGIFDDWKTVATSGFDPDTQVWEVVKLRNDSVLKYSAGIMKELSLLLDSVNMDNGSSSDDDSDSGPAADAEAMDISQSEADDAEDSEGAEDSDDAEDSDGAEDSDDAEDSDGAEDSDDAEDVALESSGEEANADEDDGDSDAAAADPNAPKPSILDDEFFSLAEVEAFADEGEEEEMRYRAILAGDYPKAPEGEDEGESSDDDDDESVDMFQDVGGLDDDDDDEDSDMDGEGAAGPRADEMKYADFFSPPIGPKRGTAKPADDKPAKRVKFDAGAAGESDAGSESDSDGDHPVPTRKSNLFDDEDDNSSNKAGADDKSEFERRQEKLQSMISKLEDEAVSDKHWTMIGEVGSNKRPKNSLLAEDLDFDHVQKPVPVITQESTVTLEDIIKRRILNEEWDDVERKKDIQAKPFRPSEAVELSDKQSKKSLAEVYEADYMAQRAGDQFVPEDETKLAAAHKDVDSQLRNLFVQLDALSHFHFAPKPAVADITIRTNAPALQMEEKLPVSMTHADQLAPGEIFDKKQRHAARTGDIVGDSELSREDRKLRRQRQKGHAKKLALQKAAQKGPAPKPSAPPEPAKGKVKATKAR